MLKKKQLARFCNKKIYEHRKNKIKTGGRKKKLKSRLKIE